MTRGFNLIRNRLTIACLFVLILTGCPPKMYGLSRYTNPTPTVVGFDCVEDYVRAIPDVQKLAYRKEKGGRPLTWSGPKPPNVIHRYSFEYLGQKMDFWLQEYWNGEIAYFGGAATTEKDRAPDLVAIARPLFTEIESGIKKCGFDSLDQVVLGDQI